MVGVSVAQTVILLIGTVAVVITLCLMNRANRLMRSANRAATRAARAADRTANITQEIGKKQVQAYVSAYRASVKWKAAKLKVSFTAKNSGASPAVHAVHKVEVRVWGEKPHVTTGVGSYTVHETPIPSGVEVEHEVDASQQLSEVASGPDGLNVWICVETVYQTVFQHREGRRKRSETRFEGRLRIGEEKALSPSGAHFSSFTATVGAVASVAIKEQDNQD